MFWVMTKRRRRQGRKEGRESEKGRGEVVNERSVIKCGNEEVGHKKMKKERG